MSYEIIYDKQFIKLPNNKFVPMVFGGSSNCTEMTYSGRERRERSWLELNYVLGKKRYASPEEMATACDNYRAELIERHQIRKEGDDKYEDRSFGYFTGLAISNTRCRSTYGQFKGLYKDGCKKAITVEELINNNGSIRVHTSNYSEDALKAAGLKEKRAFPRTSEELLAAIDEFEAMFNGTGVSWYISMDLSEHSRKWMRRQWKRDNPAKSVKKLKEYTEAYVFKIDSNKGSGWFTKFTRYGIRFASSYNSMDSYGNKRVYTEKAAEQMKQRIKSKVSTLASVEICKFELQQPVLA